MKAIICYGIMLLAVGVSQEQIAITFPDYEPVHAVHNAAEASTSVAIPSRLNQNSKYHCGSSHTLPQRILLKGDGVNVRYSPYFLNVTADKLRNEGFEVTVTEMNQDQIKAMTYTNGTTTGKSYFKFTMVIGGMNSLKVRAYAMALIGHRKKNETSWFCDGVLINHNWVLSAAHCLLNPSLIANIIRLGEYDKATEGDTDGPEIPYYDQVIDYEIEKVVPHPDFVLTERYHDLVLFKLHRPIPMLSIRIQPICLPWGKPEDKLYGVDQNLVGANVTLTGWGATSFGRLQDKTNVLQEVDLEVFDTEVCDRAYSQLQSFKTKYPRGMSEEEILCVGSVEGGKDACKGDSGGPLVYQKSDSDRFLILVGIVSGGFGCGQKEFPGLYIPVNKPKYLQWINEVAFEEYL